MENSVKDPLREDIKKTYEEEFDWLTSPTEAFITGIEYAITGTIPNKDVSGIMDARVFTYKGVQYCIALTEDSWNDAKSLSPDWGTLRRLP